MAEQKHHQDLSGCSWLEDRLARLDAVYRKFGREGLREYPLPDVSLLLWAKELENRDAPKGRDQTEAQKVLNRRLELEIKDLTGHINAQLAGANLPARRSVPGYPLREGDSERQGERGNDRQAGQERDRSRGR
jgi:hypothetical protein